MSTVTELIDSLNGIKPESTLPKETKELMKDGLIFLQDHISEKENETITQIIDTLSKGKLSQDDKKTIIKKRKIIVTIIEKYEEEFNENSNKDEITEHKTVYEVEKMLDTKILKYSGFSEIHPMTGVTYVEK